MLFKEIIPVYGGRNSVYLVVKLYIGQDKNTAYTSTHLIYKYMKKK